MAMKRASTHLPGFDQYMAMLRNLKNPAGQEDAYLFLLPHVGEYVAQLLAQLEAESDPHMQSWLLELLGEARDTRAFPVFIRYLLSPDPTLCRWAATGLRLLATTREGRRMLWEAHRHRAGLPSLASEQDYEQVLAEIASVLDG
jgi:hypothetical protein